jgi:hypothetical protein
MNDNLVPTNSNGNLPDHIGRMQNLLGGLANISQSIDEAGGVASGLPFIGINGDGVWAYGQDRTEVEPDSRWAIDIRSCKHGYIAWPPNNTKERKPLGERMVPASMPLPPVTDLPNVGAPYTLQFSFEVLCLTGEDTGTMALYKNGSYGAKVIMQNLVDAVRKQARLDQSNLCPVVKLGIRDYFHSEWKKTIYNPVLDIQKWMTFEEFDGLADGEDPPQQRVEQKPQPQPQRTAPQSEPQPQVTPTGRRRPRTQPTA